MKCALVNGFYRYSLTAAEDCSILALLWELWQCSAHRFSLLLPQAVSFSTHFSFWFPPARVASHLSPFGVWRWGWQQLHPCWWAGSVLPPCWLIFRKSCVKPPCPWAQGLEGSHRWGLCRKELGSVQVWGLQTFELPNSADPLLCTYSQMGLGLSCTDFSIKN